MASSNSFKPINNIRDFLFAEMGLNGGLLSDEILQKGQETQEEMSTFGIKVSLMNVFLDKKLLDKETVREIFTSLEEVEVYTGCCRSKIKLKGLSQDGKLKCPKCDSLNCFDLKEDISRIPGRSDSNFTRNIKGIVIGENKAESNYSSPSPTAAPTQIEEPSSLELSPKKMSAAQLKGANATRKIQKASISSKSRKFNVKSLSPKVTEKLVKLSEKLELPALSGFDLHEKIKTSQTKELAYRGLHGPLFKCQKEGKSKAVKILGTTDQLTGCPLTKVKEELSLWSSIPSHFKNPDHDLTTESEVVYVERPYLDSSEYSPLSDCVNEKMEVRTTIFRRVLEQVTDVHKAGRVHGNLKPSNIWYSKNSKNPNIVLLDPGLDKIITGDNTLDRWELMIQAPNYISPEQIQGETSQATSDVYALGWILFELLTGNPPFQNLKGAEILKAHLEGPCPDLKASHEKWEKLHEAMTAVRTEDRIPNASGVLQAFDQILANRNAHFFNIQARTQSPCPVTTIKSKASSSVQEIEKKTSYKVRAALGPIVLVGAIAWLGFCTSEWQEVSAEFKDPSRLESLYLQTLEAAFKKTKSEARSNPSKGKQIWKDFLETFPNSPKEGAARAEIRNLSSK